MRKTRANLFLIIIAGISICVFSCKKEKKEIAPPPSTSKPITLQGDFKTYFEKDSNNVLIYASANVKFWNPCGNGYGQDPDSVSLNGVWLKVGSDFRYGSWSSSAFPPFNCNDSIVWHTTGSDSVPVISYTTTKPIPYIDTSCLSIDTFDIADTLIISHPAIYATTIEYWVSGSNGSLNPIMAKTVNGKSTGVVFYPTDVLPDFAIGMKGELWILATNTESYSPQPGTVYNFSNKCIVKKRIIIK